MSPNNVADRKRSPGTRIAAVIAVITHDEYMVFREAHLRPVISKE